MRDQIILISDVFAAANDVGRKRISTIVFNRGSKLDDIANGSDLGTVTFEQAMIWFSANWPEGTEWPQDVERPVDGERQAAE